MKKPEDVYQFPCTLDFKVIAYHKDDIESTILKIITSQGISTDGIEVLIRPSKNNKYWAITLPITFNSKTQLDSVHEALNEHQDIIMTL